MVQVISAEVSGITTALVKVPCRSSCIYYIHVPFHGNPYDGPVLHLTDLNAFNDGSWFHGPTPNNPCEKCLCCISKDAAIPRKTTCNTAAHPTDQNRVFRPVVVYSGTPCSARCHHSHLLFSFWRAQNSKDTTTVMHFPFFYTSFGRAPKYVLYLIYDEFEKKKYRRAKPELH